MQTYSHFLLTAVLHKAILPNKPDAAAGLLAGSFAPDVPLALLSTGYVVDRRFIRRHLPDKTRCSPTYNDLYFNNPWWIAAHNSLHAPLPLFALAMIAILLRRRWLLWFAVSCGLHTAVDIFTHVDDGPALLFPLNWRYRFKAPVSYWDPAHGGRTFRLIEHLLDVMMILYLILQRTSAKREPTHV
ncbi:MAG: metal-dependent hydrolase [Anaerolineales bacterium]|nr:metal-dependent hydrolase [Anaerolineales bacterium]